MELASKGYLKEVVERSNANEKYLELFKGKNLNRIPRRILRIHNIRE